MTLHQQNYSFLWSLLESLNTLSQSEGGGGKKEMCRDETMSFKCQKNILIFAATKERKSVVHQLSGNEKKENTQSLTHTAED